MSPLDSEASEGKDLPSVPALGRPFRIGDYYHQETEQMVLGLPIWSVAEMGDNIIKPNHRTEVSQL